MLIFLHNTLFKLLIYSTLSSGVGLATMEHDSDVYNSFSMSRFWSSRRREAMYVSLIFAMKLSLSKPPGIAMSLAKALVVSLWIQGDTRYSHLLLFRFKRKQVLNFLITLD